MRANEATYGPKNTVPIVVLKAEFAQSYIAQPKISFLSFIIAVSFAIHPPSLKLVIIETTQGSISSFGCNVKKLLLSQSDGRAIIGACADNLDEELASFAP
ncbi:hypothetical protein [Candidatus Villigracilis proximus]|uniref:hypothetical protein n=1 Tax=Candidatus Villigracilis proximus TaxID=3140683 RepID=UPI0031E772D8